MDRFLNLIVAGDISSKTKATLMKQLNEQVTVPPLPAEAQAKPAVSAAKAAENVNANMTGEATAPARRREVARADNNITDPVTRIVGLILGSPEFQRQ
jgi:hypothetical protein